MADQVARDPYKYFRVEARELLEGISQGIMQLEKGAPAPDVVARLLRLAHTLKGAARVVKQPEIADLAHKIEDHLDRQRAARAPLEKDQANELLMLLDSITARLTVLEPARDGVNSGPAPGPAEEALETVRVEIQEMDAVLRGVAEAGVQLGSVRKGLAAADRLRESARMLSDWLADHRGSSGGVDVGRVTKARALAEDLKDGIDRLQRSLDVGFERVEGELVALRGAAHRLRLIPANTVFPSLERSARDAAQTMGKRIAFEATGGEVRLDVEVLAALRDALMHLVRNAVAHGLERQVERVAMGKPPIGVVRIRVQQHGGRVSFSCGDDGRGIDVEAVRAAAVAKGLVAPVEARMLDADQVIALLPSGKLTTTNHVTELSGRGVGLDVVRVTAARVKGELSIRSEAGRGVTVEIQVPISISSLQVLVVEAAGTLASIPLDAVRETRRVHASEIARSAGNDSMLHAGKVIPFRSLERLLRRPRAGDRNRAALSMVVVQGREQCVALGVDRLLGTSSIVMLAVPKTADADPIVAGASLDAEGYPQLVLDAEGLVAAADRAASAPPDSETQRDPILVVDDSLTTRMLEQNILESAGYQVELAVSAEEALLKARGRRYSLFLVDVEMPGMDGFEFVTRTRSDPSLGDIPAILVTSRSADDDRRRGEQAGARAYIVKGEFDQAQLLQTIRTLIG